MSARFRRRRSGIELRLSAAEADVVRGLPDQLRAVYDQEAGTDPARERLFPRAYLDPTEDRAEREWQELVHPELLRERLAVLECVTAALGVGPGAVKAELSTDDAHAWLAMLNDLRLVLGSRLGIADDTDVEAAVSALPPDDPQAALGIVYLWLTGLQGDLIEILLVGLPEDAT